MKKIILFSIALFLFAYPSISQSNKAYYAQEITWFGLDYSQAYFMDNIAFPDPYKLQNKLFLEWNNFIFSEPSKFDIAESFNKTSVLYSTSFINNRNSRADIFDHIVTKWANQIMFNSDTIQEIVSSYNIPTDNTGVGLVFIVESLNKPNRQGVYWVTFFDIETKKVLLSNQIIGTPGGVGLKNYWANSFYNALAKSGRSMGFIF